MSQPSTRHLRAHLARALMCLLLVGITHAATSTSAHSHETDSSDHSASGTNAVNVSGTPQTDSHFHNHQCLICQLQRNLFNGLLYKAPSTPVPQAQRLVYATSLSVFYYSLVNTPQRGRAPPLASLL